ncbi:MAG: MarC family protein [Deltaproteobacteria bacterium]|nr:MarC family protein [Deltaproteobacteria bacterium]
MLEKLSRDFIILWATLDPIGTLPLFLAVTSHMNRQQKRKTAWKAAFYAGGVLLGFIVGGQVVMTYLDIRLGSFQVAGGIILFLFGLQMIFGSAGQTTPAQTEAGHDPAVFPLAIPSIASPGAIMAVVLLTDNDLFDITTQAATAGLMLGILGVTLLLMLAAHRIHRVLGYNGEAIVIRVTGMLLASLAVEMVLHGLVSLRLLVGG